MLAPLVVVRVQLAQGQESIFQYFKAGTLVSTFWTLEAPHILDFLTLLTGRTNNIESLYLTTMATPRAAVRFVAGSRKSPSGTLHLHLHVKPGASKVREGITAVTHSAIELCVAAQPRDGEANKAVIGLLSDVLGVPKSRLEVAQGSRSKEKTAVVRDVNNQDAEAYTQLVLGRLSNAVE